MIQAKAALVLEAPAVPAVQAAQVAQAQVVQTLGALVLEAPAVLAVRAAQGQAVLGKTDQENLVETNAILFIAN